MPEMLGSVLISLAIAVALAIPAFVIQTLLTKNGIVRNGQLGVVVCTVLAVFARQIWFQDISWWFGVPFILWAAILGVNRADLWTTANRGRWWWKASDKAMRDHLR